MLAPGVLRLSRVQPKVSHFGWLSAGILARRHIGVYRWHRGHHEVLVGGALNGESFG